MYVGIYVSMCHYVCSCECVTWVRLCVIVCPFHEYVALVAPIPIQTQTLPGIPLQWSQILAWSPSQHRLLQLDGLK